MRLFKAVLEEALAKIGFPARSASASSGWVWIAPAASPGSGLLPSERPPSAWWALDLASGSWFRIGGGGTGDEGVLSQQQQGTPWGWG